MDVSNIMSIGLKDKQIWNWRKWEKIMVENTLANGAQHSVLSPEFSTQWDLLILHSWTGKKSTSLEQSAIVYFLHFFTRTYQFGSGKMQRGMLSMPSILHHQEQIQHRPRLPISGKKDKLLTWGCAPLGASAGGWSPFQLMAESYHKKVHPVYICILFQMETAGWLGIYL